MKNDDVLQALMSKSYFVEHFLRRTNLRGFHYFAYGVCNNFKLSQSSIIITCFHHVAHKHYFKKVKGVLPV